MAGLPSERRRGIRLVTPIDVKDRKYVDRTGADLIERVS